MPVSRCLLSKSILLCTAAWRSKLSKSTTTSSCVCLSGTCLQSGRIAPSCSLALTWSRDCCGPAMELSEWLSLRRLEFCSDSLIRTHESFFYWIEAIVKAVQHIFITFTPTLEWKPDSCSLFRTGNTACSWARYPAPWNWSRIWQSSLPALWAWLSAASGTCCALCSNRSKSFDCTCSILLTRKRLDVQRSLCFFYCLFCLSRKVESSERL